MGNGKPAGWDDVEKAEEKSVSSAPTTPVVDVQSIALDAGHGIKITSLKSGATQAAAAAVAMELWKTSGHATLPDNVVMIGI